MLTALLPFLTSFIFSALAVPSVIRLAYHKRLVDDPRLESRKVHHQSVPNLGGVAVFSAFALVSCLFVDATLLPHANFIFAAGIIIFGIGLKDDLIALDPYKKFLAQFITAFIVVYCADLRYTSFYGVLGLTQISPVLSYTFTTFFVVFTINAFNLIDGINGLLGSLSLIICICFGILFMQLDEKGFSVLSFSMAGAVTGFLRYNFGKTAKIFMGDAGAYSVGFIIAILSIRFVELDQSKLSAHASGLFAFIKSSPALVLALLIVPVFDTFRVFSLRILKGKSPFYPDRQHVHHRLLALGLSHPQATLLITFANVLIIVLAVGLQQDVNTPELMLIISLGVVFFNALLWLYEVRNFPPLREEKELSAQTAYQIQSLLKNEPNEDPSTTGLVIEPDLVKSTMMEDADRKRFTQEMLDNLEKSKN